MASEISSISHLGVEVAPQTPMELAPANRELSISWHRLSNVNWH